MVAWNNHDVQDSNELTMDFDTGAVAPSTFDVLPDGDYPVSIKSVAIKPMVKDPNGRRVNVQLVVTDGQHKGRVVFDGIITHLPSSEKAEQIGRQQLAGLLQACGIAGERNLANLVGHDCVARIKTQPADGQYEARNVVRGYRPSSGAASFAPPAAAPVAANAPQKQVPSFMAKKPPSPSLAK